jgi:hypothetical protein
LRFHLRELGHPSRRSPVRFGGVLDERRLLMGGFATTLMDLGEPANGGKVLRRRAEHVFELCLSVVVLFEFDERTPERDARGEIGGMSGEPAAADVYGFLLLSLAAVFLGELCEGDRRRILLDPASKLVDTWVVRQSTLRPMLSRHYFYGTSTATACVAVAVEPLLSRTVNCTS